MEEAKKKAHDLARELVALIDEGRDPWTLLGVKEPSLRASWQKRIIGLKRRVDYNGLERAAIEAALSPTAGFHAAEAALFCARDVFDHFLGRRAVADVSNIDGARRLPAV